MKARKLKRWQGQRSIFRRHKELLLVPNEPLFLSVILLPSLIAPWEWRNTGNDVPAKWWGTLTQGPRAFWRRSARSGDHQATKMSKETSSCFTNRSKNFPDCFSSFYSSHLLELIHGNNSKRKESWRQAVRGQWTSLICWPSWTAISDQLGKGCSCGIHCLAAPCSAPSLAERETHFASSRGWPLGDLAHH